MKLTEEGRDTIEKVRLISGSSFEQSKDFFESFMAYAILNYLDGKDTYVPYFGSVKIINKGDTYTSIGREAVVSIEFIPDYNLKKIVGQIADEEETEIEKVFLKKIRGNLESTLD